MALNWNVFKTRALTAVVFVIVMLAGLLWNQWSFLILFSIIHFGCWWEYFNLLEKINQSPVNPYLRQGFMMVGYGFLLFNLNSSFQISGYPLNYNLALPVSIAGFAMLLIGIFQPEKIVLKQMAQSALGWIYISLSWTLMLDLYQTSFDIHMHDTMLVFEGNFIPVVLIASIWINDTMAYIVGSFIGRTPLSPISPKKTWEGTIGGIVLSVIVVALLASLLFVGPFDWIVAVFGAVIALVASITGTLGDLLESKIKRKAGVKDSGSLMPGHGGFLDRFDSLLLATTAVALTIFLLTKTIGS
ncbi:MAG: phosphatidate cytidylyltransferase [Chitinophagaceae bacterium]